MSSGKGPNWFCTTANPLSLFDPWYNPAQPTTLCFYFIKLLQQSLRDWMPPVQGIGHMRNPRGVRYHIATVAARESYKVPSACQRIRAWRFEQSYRTRC